MAEGRKGRKVGRHKRNGQALRYKNSHMWEQNRLRRLKRYIAGRGVTGMDVLATLHRCQDVLGITRSDLKVQPPRPKRPKVQPEGMTEGSA